MNKYRILMVCAMTMMLAGCSGEAKTVNVKLDKDKPVNLAVWHYYNGTQKMAFDSLISEFNETVGKEKGIYVESHSKGDVGELEEAVLSSSRKEVGSDEMPNIFSAYADTAYIIDQTGMLADLSVYLTEEEQASYEDSYIEEGRMGADNGVKIFPVAKSTEVLMVNKTVWDEFSAATGASEEELKTVEGIVRLAQDYYSWTDETTPDIPNDGLAFYGRDAMANLFVITSMQKGMELFQVENKKVSVNVSRDVFKQIWDTYYIPSVKGYFGAYGRFRSDDAKIGKLAAYTGSIASASYFPEQVEIGDTVTPITCMVMPAPLVEGGEPYIIQQGAGMVVTKKSAEEEYASVEFLKWFTELENNIRFGCTSGYLPVKKAQNKNEILDSVIEKYGFTIRSKEYDTLLTAYDMVDSNKLYTNKAFEGGTTARKVLEFNLSDKAKADRAQVEIRLSEGLSLDEAAAEFISDEAFEKWFTDIQSELQTCVGLGETAAQK